jgi:fibronectin type 3 domain-containing protein
LALGDHTVNVQERDEAGNWSVSGTKVIGIKPLAPTNVAAADSTSTSYVTISWTAAAGATAYYVDRSTTSTGTYSNIGNTAGTSYNDATANPGSTYYYKVRAFAASYYSDPSAYDSGLRKLSAPTGVTASDNTNASYVAVSWTAPTGTVSSYYVDRSTTSTGTYSNIGTSTTTSYNDTSATAAVVYYYKIRAYSGGYYSDPSGYDSGVRQLPAPTGVAATDGSVSTGITVSWSAVSGATSYTVYSSTDNVSFGSVASGVATTSWTDTTIGASANYY